MILVLNIYDFLVQSTAKLRTLKASQQRTQLLFPRHRGALTCGYTLASLINAGKELLLADKAVIFSYWHNLEVACAGGQDYALPTGGQAKILALICSEIAYAYNSHNYIFSANIMNTILVSKLLCIILVVSYLCGKMCSTTLLS